MNQVTYILSENEQVIMETQAASVDSAVDYFMEMKPDLYDNFTKYSIGLKQRKF